MQDLLAHNFRLRSIVVKHRDSFVALGALLVVLLFTGTTKGADKDRDFDFQKDDTVAIPGSGLADRIRHDGWTETLLQSGLKNKGVRYRNMAISADHPNKYPRSKGFTPMDKYLRIVKVK